MRNKTSILLAAILIAAIAGWLIRGNSAPEVSRIAVGSSDIPAAFDGYRIAHISDLHDAELGNNHARLINVVQKACPDMIVLTGDMIDSSRTDIDNTLAFVRQAARIAPIYYVNGNHEALVSRQEYGKLTDGLRSCGAIVLEDERVMIERGGAVISLIGLNDIGHIDVPGVDAKIAAMRQILESLLKENPGFSVVLSHRPELMDTYSQTTADLVLSGHAHGGQFRLPFIGGLIAPGQGLLPKYDAGLYTENGTAMIVSRGIGNSVIPIRFNNRPEIIVVELKTK